MVTPAASPSAGWLPWLTGALAQALRTQRGHALLVHGAEGAGQFDFAIALARAWLCETPPAERAHGLACGHCESCHLARADQVHPDLGVLLPEALQLALGWWQKGDDPESADAKARKPSQWIAIQQVRAAIEFSSLTRSRGRLKVMVIYPAERLQTAAASALLKLLEEPQGGQRLVLASADAAALLPTVRSRCHAVRLPTPDPAQAAQWLADRGLPDAALLLAAHGGQPLAAVQCHAQGLDAALWQRLPALVAAGDAQPLARLPLPLLIECLQKLCHDTLLSGCNVAPRYFPRHSLAASPPGIQALTDWAQSLRRAARSAEHPWNAALKLEALLAQGQRALGGADSVHLAR